MNELFNEVRTSMKSNRLRIALTGFSIGWGMFILVVLLGSSNGFQRGLYKTFHLDLAQMITVTTGKTSQTWNGLNKGRTLTMHLSDANALAQSKIEHIQKVRPSITQSFPIGYDNKSVQVSVTGCGSDFMPCEFRRISLGRDINELDMKDNRKVCIVNTKLATQFFGKDNAIGKEIAIDSLAYTVIGVCETMLSEEMELVAYIPLSTMMTIYHPDNTIDRISIIVGGMKNTDENELLGSEIHQLMASRLQCAPTDNKGVKVSNEYEQAQKAVDIISAIGIFVWIIGIATLIAGIVGVSNIMMITVKERTRELGVRKAMGASDEHIISLVIMEAILITLIFGYIGIMAGVGLTQLLNIALGDAFPMFQHPVVQFWTIMGCNVILVIAGIIAGYVPAKHAVSVKLVDALTS